MIKINKLSWFCLEIGTQDNLFLLNILGLWFIYKPFYSAEKAQKRLDRLLSNKDYRESYFSGDKIKLNEIMNLNASILKPTEKDFKPMSYAVYRQWKRPEHVDGDGYA